jgi:hypothetical protein
MALIDISQEYMPHSRHNWSSGKIKSKPQSSSHPVRMAITKKTKKSNTIKDERNSHTLLVEMLITMVIMENRMEVPQKTRNTTTI